MADIVILLNCARTPIFYTTQTRCKMQSRYKMLTENKDCFVTKRIQIKFAHTCLMVLCSSRKYPYLPRKRDFFKDLPQTPLEIPIKPHTFLYIFWPYRTPYPPGHSDPLCRGVWIFSGAAHWILEKLLISSILVSSFTSNLYGFFWC